jgi:hypothetical protein
MNRAISLILIICFLTACSTTGGMYKKDDAENGEFSPGRTLLGVIGAVGLVLGAKELSKNGGGGSSYADTGYAWDYQPGNGQWACRNKANGQYAHREKCNGLPYVDNWP